jgi:hypothetical protein
MMIPLYRIASFATVHGSLPPLWTVGHQIWCSVNSSYTWSLLGPWFRKNFLPLVLPLM